MDFFHNARGFHPGDPLSYLTDSSTICFFTSKKNELMKGFSTNVGGDVVSVNQCVDDTLVLMRTDLNLVDNFWVFLLWFEATSCLHVNMSKITVYKVNMVDCSEDILQTWRHNEGMLPNINLGIPLTLSFKHIIAWQGLIEKILSRLTQ